MTTDICDPHDPRSASEIYLNCNIDDGEGKPPTDTPADGWPLDPNFPSKDEIDNIYDLIDGYTDLFFALVPYRNLLTTVDEIDDIHGEIVEVQKRWADPVMVRAFTNPSEYTQPGTRYGIEEARNIDLLIAVPDLLQSALATQGADLDITLVARIGDLFWYHKREYVVTSIVPAEYWANTDIPLYYYFKAELQRDNAVDTWGNY